MVVVTLQAVNLFTCERKCYYPQADQGGRLRSFFRPGVGNVDLTTHSHEVLLTTTYDQADNVELENDEKRGCGTW